MYIVHLTIEESYRPKTNAATLRQAAEATLQRQSVTAAALSILVTGDEAVRRLNAHYRDVDAPTDVLSFEDGSPDPETGIPYLGDIAIAYPRAAAQAAQGGHPVAWELCLLVVHGVLHLLGHDHATPADKARMWAAQREVLESLGCPLSPP